MLRLTSLLEAPMVRGALHAAQQNCGNGVLDVVDFSEASLTIGLVIVEV